MIEVIQRQAGDISDFSDAIPPLLQRIYAARGIHSDAELGRSLQSLLPFTTFKGMDEAVAIVAQAMRDGRHIVIVGDFDADGATSTALMLLALRMLAAGHVSYLIPSRFDDGYGLTPGVVEQAQAQGAELIITVDNGISSVDGVAHAHSLGMSVVVTDHHLPGKELPNADAIVNPNTFNSGFGSRDLAGVGVAFYTMMALRKYLREQRWFEEKGLSEPNLATLLDLVAVGTVADVVPLDMNNRILVHQGLMRIRQGHCRPGIKALIDVSRREQAYLTSTDLGFALGPRLNAAGRLDNMSSGIELLLTQDPYEAAQQATELDALNQSRKEIEHGMKQEALAICERLQFSQADMPFGLVLYQSEWHQGVIGIVASRVKDLYHRPVIVFAQAEDGLLKGSCRSIAGFHMKDALEALDSKYPELIIKFGGHAMAAGLTISPEHFDEFCDRFDALVRRKLTPEALKGTLITDGVLQREDFNLTTAEMIRDAGPWGQHFPEPLFEGRFRILNQKLVGQKHLKLMLEPQQGGPMLDAIAFNVDLDMWPDASVSSVYLVYRLDINHFRGQSNLQLMIEHIN